ncbi:tyrosine protein phosphatase (plasmid) [Nitratireductor sp. GISD-1A_MAKvit]|uniref:tyrosine phosphatase family protein n=1 Tax=Nitratireductor sp. GISD-1A_MAKvit TaxID=3234198 RepID=UPI0034667FBB
MLYVCPASQLERMLKATRAQHMVSLTSSSEPPALAQIDTVPERLHLAMHDISDLRPGLIAPAFEQIEALLGFARDWNWRSPLVVHCHAGISRSTAAAYVIANLFAREMDEVALAHMLRERAPSATPNRRIVALGDRLLEREGRMIRAIHQIGRGREAFAGEPFHYPAR